MKQMWCRSKPFGRQGSLRIASLHLVATFPSVFIGQPRQGSSTDLQRFTTWSPSVQARRRLCLLVLIDSN